MTKCPTCGHKPTQKRAASAFRHVAPPSYKGGWPSTGYVPLDAPAIDWGHRSLIAATLGRMGNASTVDRVMMNGIEVPNATIEEAAA